MTGVDIPFHRNPDFLGRETELTEIHIILEEDGRAFVTGIGGMGKTQLLLEYAHMSKRRFGKLLCNDASSQAKVKSLSDLAKKLGVQLTEKPDQEKENAQHVRDALERIKVPCLMVMDNVDSEAGLWDLLLRHGLCQVSHKSSYGPSLLENYASCKIFSMTFLYLSRLNVTGCAFRVHF